jgi:sulfite exporter TauE/SafE
MINRILAYIGKSVTKNGQISSTRIASYFILGGILTSIGTFAGIELVNAIIMWNKGLTYIVPSEHVIIFGMVLAHHLTLLGINKNHETKVEQAVQDKLKSHNQINPKDMSTDVPSDSSDAPSDSEMS